MLSREMLKDSVSKLQLEVSRQDYDDQLPDNLGIVWLPSGFTSTSADRLSHQDYELQH
jgi:hypothetical protein